MTIKGTESVRKVGDFWIVSEVKATLFDAPFTGVMTLGFDSQKKKYVGTWIDSMHSHLLHYDGTVADKTLKRGRYRLVARAEDSTGARSNRLRRKFRIVAPAGTV